MSAQFTVGNELEFGNPFLGPVKALLCRSSRRISTASAIQTSLADKGKKDENKDELLVVVGGGAAGVYGAIRAKTLAPDLRVSVIEKGRFLSKVKIFGGGRCNVTNGYYNDTTILAEHYPHGHKELKGSFFYTHGPADTMSWFSEHGVPLKISFSKVHAKLILENTRLGSKLAQIGPLLVTHLGGLVDQLFFVSLLGVLGIFSLLSTKV